MPRFTATLAAMMALLLCGCRTTPSMAPVDVSGPGWTVQQGQALWRPRTGAAEVVGDLYIASHRDGRSLVQFSKPPIPLIVAQTDGEHWAVRFVPRDKSYGGNLPPPDRLIWPRLAHVINGENSPDGWQFERMDDGGWLLKNEKTGERLEGYVELPANDA